MSAREAAGMANLRHHWLGVAVLGVLVQNKPVSRFMDGDTLNRLVDRCIEDPAEPVIADLLGSTFDAGFGSYDLTEWFPNDDARTYAKRIVEALHQTSVELGLPCPN